jgi:hypothetical protein
MADTTSECATIQEPVQRPINQLDILDVIMDICEGEKMYGTILLLGMLSKHHRAVAQPRLKRIRKRVVLDLNEFPWRDPANDSNVE